MSLNDILYEACKSGDIINAKLAVEKGANNFYWAIRDACQYEQLEIVKWLYHRNQGNGMNIPLLFNFVCRYGHSSVLTLLDTFEQPYNYICCLRNAFDCYNLSTALWLLQNKSLSCDSEMLYYPQDAQSIIFFLQQGIPREKFKSINDIELLWKKLDDQNKALIIHISPLSIPDLNNIVHYYLIY